MFDFLGGMLIVFAYVFLFVLVIALVKTVWSHGVQILRTMLSVFVLIGGLVLAGALLHALEVAFQ